MEVINFDGLWLDENEPTGLCNGNISDYSSFCGFNTTTSIIDDSILGN